FELKGRPAHKPIGLLAADAGQAAEIADLDEAGDLVRYWPGALTLVVRPKVVIPDWVGNSALGTVGIRVPDHDLLRRLPSETGPLAVTSATSREGRRLSTTKRRRLCSATPWPSTCPVAAGEARLPRWSTSPARSARSSEPVRWSSPKTTEVDRRYPHRLRHRCAFEQIGADPPRPVQVLFAGDLGGDQQPLRLAEVGCCGSGCRHHCVEPVGGADPLSRHRRLDPEEVHPPQGHLQLVTAP